VIAFLLQVALEIWSILQEASAYLLLGFVLAGGLAVLVPAGTLMRLFRAGRIRSVLWASAIGTPLPLCSCGVLPTALGLARQGATRGATVSFLISTPETGVDSIALSWALLDPIMTVFRPVAAFLTAVVAGIATNLWGVPHGAAAEAGGPPAAEAAPGAELGPDVHLPRGGAEASPRQHAARLRRVFTYAFRDLLDEMAHWLVLGIVLAAIVAVLLPASLIERYLGGGFSTMLAMLLIGIPIYTCASASTPIAAALVLKGLNPGAALVFLLSGPATNVGTIVVLLKFLGRRVVAIYLASIAVVSLLAGYALNWIYARWEVNPAATFGKAGGFVPEPVKIAAAVVLTGLLISSLWRTPVPEEWGRLSDRLAGLIGFRLTARRLGVPAAAALVVLYLGSGFFAVGPGQVAVTTRFGRIVAPELGPGLHYRWPWPVGEHRMIQRDLVRRIEVGFRTEPRRDTLERALARDLTLAGPRFPVPPAGTTGFWFQKERVPDEALLLTGDENIIEIGFTAQYRVQDPVAFAYTVADPESVVSNVTMAALRATVATMKVDGVYSTERGAIEARVLRDAQALLDAYRVGVHMVAVSLLSVHAPEEVHGAFRDVASAQEDKAHIIDRASAFASEAVNLAEGDAAAMVQSALAFREQKILEAEGDALAFSLREKEYRRAPDVTRFRLHLETLEEALPPAQKILRPVGRDVKEFDLWLLQPFAGKKAP